MSKNFIIMEEDPVVAMDLEETLKTHFPASHVVVGNTLAALGSAIHNCGVQTVLFFRAQSVLQLPDLARVLTVAATRGGRIILIGMPEKFEFPATFLDLPFTSEMVLGLLRD